MGQSLTAISKVAICGIGQMGTAAALCFERSGFDVLLWARNPDKLAGVETKLNSLRIWTDENLGPPRKTTGRVCICDDLGRLDGEADLIMECICEDIQEKTELLRRFTRAATRGAIFVSATSGLSITHMGRLAGIEHLLVGAHFWNPPHLMPLVEVIRGENSSPEVFDLVCQLIESIGKFAVRVERDVPGFIGNRIMHAMWREAIRLVQDGVAS
ncbi:3-hydroxyacyl-CoA dehydrogenase family protein, partial [candidate division KSB1 bacterium]|nr:3-hydroxyacyl-CoA dehydrogenase family protein [candidate division KSB1 bacterium]